MVLKRLLTIKMTKNEKQAAYNKSGLSQTDLGTLSGTNQTAVLRWLRVDDTDSSLRTSSTVKIEKFINEYNLKR